MRLAPALLLLLAGCASDVTTAEVRRLVQGGARLVDVRTRAEFAERHVARSINIPVEELKQRAGELAPRDRPIVVYCHTGVRSGFAVWLLRKAGFTAVYNLGSIARWYREHDPQPAPLY